MQEKKKCTLLFKLFYRLYGNSNTETIYMNLSGSLSIMEETFLISRFFYIEYSKSFP